VILRLPWGSLGLPRCASRCTAWCARGGDGQGRRPVRCGGSKKDSCCGNAPPVRDSGRPCRRRRALVRRVGAGARRAVQRATGSTSPVHTGPDHHAAHPDVPRSAIYSPTRPQSGSVCQGSMSSFQPQADGVKPRRGGRAAAGPIATRGPSRACSATRAPPQAPLFRRRTRTVRWPNPRPHCAACGRTRPAGRCSSSRGARWYTAFHDAMRRLRGDDVARAGRRRGSRCPRQVAGEVVRGSVHDLVHHDPTLRGPRGNTGRPHCVVWNPAARPRAGYDRRRHRCPPAMTCRPARERSGGRGRATVRSRSSHRTARSVPVQVLDRRIGTERSNAATYPDQDE